MSNESQKFHSSFKELVDIYKKELAKRIITIEDLKKHNQILKEQIARINDKCDGLEDLLMTTTKAVAERSNKIDELQEANDRLNVVIEKSLEDTKELQEENTRLHNVIDLGKKGSLNPDAESKVRPYQDPDRKITPEDKRRLRIQGKAKAEVRDRKAQELHDRNPK